MGLVALMSLVGTSSSSDSEAMSTSGADGIGAGVSARGVATGVDWTWPLATGVVAGVNNHEMSCLTSTPVFADVDVGLTGHAYLISATWLSLTPLSLK